MSQPAPPHERVAPRPPPQVVPADGAAGLAMNALPMLGSVGSIVLVTSTSAGGSGVLRMVAGAMFVLTTLGFVAVQVDRQRSQRHRQRRGARSAYLQHLAGVRRRLRSLAERQRRALLAEHPEPALAAAGGPSGTGAPPGWSTSPASPLLVRWGTGERDADVDLVAPAEPEGEVDPVAGDALRRLLAVHARVPDLPLLLDLAATPRLDVTAGTAAGPADPEDAVGVLRALVVSAAHSCAPDRLRVTVSAPPGRRSRWDWVKWLPHAGPGPGAGAAGAHLLVVHDRDDPPPGPTPGVTVLLAAPATTTPGALVLGLAGASGGREVLRTPWGGAQVGRADRCGPAAAEAAARRLAPLAPTRADAGATRPGGPTAAVAAALGLPGLLAGAAGRDGPADGASPAAPRGADRPRLRVPIGIDPAGALVHLDLRESAHGGTGPHGLVVGATGSGKSELLRTLVLGLAATHPPDELNLVLVDYKGGATFTGLAALPHTSALITNLADEAVLVSRMGDALAGEVLRRQELLRAAGPYASRHDLEVARRAGADVAPLPSLLVVVDEFSELLVAQPAFAELFATIGRLGRSLGVHLLLASQRLDEGRLRGLETHLSYRVALRTFTTAESRTVLGVPDAAGLPPVPGVGLLRTGPEELVRFTAAYVSAPARPARVPEAPAPPVVVPFTLDDPDRDPPPAAPPVAPRPEPHPDQGPSLLEEVVARLDGQGPPAHRVWLPPLDRSPALADLLGPLTTDPRHGLVAATWRERPGLPLPLGVVDRPREQRRDLLVVDLATAGGHLLTVGGPRSGTSTLLRTAVTTLALTTTPEETRCYVLDLGGGALAGLAGLPHVAAVVPRARPDVVRRLLAELRGELDAREAEPPGRRARPRPRLVLVVDRWDVLREGDGAWEQEVTALAARGPGLGLHLLASARRHADVRPAARDLLGHRVELRLGDPLDSEVDRRRATEVPADRPGRGLAGGGQHLLTALPLGATGEPEDALVARAAAAWPGERAPGLRLLPERVALATVHDRAEVRAGGPLWLGLDEERLAPVGLDPGTEPHLLVLGDTGSGRTTLLRLLAREVVRSRTPAQAQLLVVDPRRTLLGEVPAEHLLGHVGDDEQVREHVDGLAAHLRTRLPHRDLDAATLRRRDWWRGAEVWVLVDDHELVGAGGPNGAGATSPLAPLAPLLARAGDVGLHVVLARRAGGSGRAAYDPLVQSLGDLGAPGLLLSATQAQGPLLGLRPAAAPAGRGRLVTRADGVRTVQVAWTEPAAAT